MNDWPGLERLGAELQRGLARREHRRRWLSLPRLVPAVLVLVALIASAAVATNGRLVEGLPAPWSASDPAAVRPLPLEPLRAADPAHGPAWGLRLATGGSVICQAVGQVVGGRIGVLRGRVFHPLPPGYRDRCAAVATNGASVGWNQYPGPNVGRRGARTVVHGVAGAQVVAIAVTTRDGVIHRLPLSPRSGFIAAFPGLLSPPELAVQISLNNGTSKTYSGDHK